MSTAFHVIIPARFQSTRFPGKLLQDIAGKTVIERVYQQAVLANPKSILIATDHDAIAELARGFGAEVVMTAVDHQTGTDRIAEVVSKCSFSGNDIVVNVQGDEPFIEPQLIRQVALSLAQSSAPVATLCWPIDSLEKFQNSNVVKVVRSKENKALYFSRAPVPAQRDNPKSFAGSYSHIGIYAYRAAFLLDYVSWAPCDLEKFEALEQLRILWNGYSIQVDEALVKPLQDINTVEDLAKARQMVEGV